MTSRGKALVTGGAGLIGSHLTDLLIESGYDVVILDCLEPQTHPNGKPGWIHPDACFIQGDIRRDEDLKKALDGVDVVFHQAAFGGFIPGFSKYFDVNAIGTAKIFECIEANHLPVRKVVVASSQAIYAEGAYVNSKGQIFYPRVRGLDQLNQRQWELMDPEKKEFLRPTLTAEGKSRDGETAYALSKEFEERIALSYGKKLGIPTVALRYAVTYGPRQSVFNPYTGVVSIFSTRILNNLSPVLYEDGLQTRDFIFVKDVARANLFVMERDDVRDCALNVGTGKPSRVSDLVVALNRVYRTSIEPEIRGEFRLGDVRHIVLHPGRLQNLGFEALTPIEEGLGFYKVWIETQGKVKEYFSQAYETLRNSHFIFGGKK